MVINQIGFSAQISYNRQGEDVEIDYSDLITFVAISGLTSSLYPTYNGDSGSALIADFSGEKKIIGLVFAGNDYTGAACRIDKVSELLNISAWNGESVNYSDISNIEEITIDGLSDDEYIISSGKTYWQVGLR